MTPAPTLSVALIVRNESSEILHCLRTVEGADQVVVVDTGSVDDTVALVESLRYGGLVVSHFPWVDDFSAARNYALSLCTCDWVLTISADGRLREGAIQQLRADIAACQRDAIALWQCSKDGSQLHRRVLLHKRLPHIKWVGRVHENLNVDSDYQSEVVMDYGWSASHRFDPHRNMRILQSEFDSRPSARTAYYLAAEHFTAKRYGDALPLFGYTVTHGKWTPEVVDALLYMAKCEWQLGQGEKARHHLMDALLRNPECKEALLLLSTMCWPEYKGTWLRYAATADNSGVLFDRTVGK